MNNMELHIIDAAIACIEKRGLQEATVRAIAEEAGVNVAAINYYFRSKEQLIERVMEQTLNNAFDWSHFGPGEAVAADQRLADILDHLTQGAQQYPQIARMHFYETLTTGQCPPQLGERFGAFLQSMFDDLRGRGVLLGDIDLRRTILQAMSTAIFGMVLLAPLFQPFQREQYEDPATRRQALLALARRALGEDSQT